MLRAHWVLMIFLLSLVTCDALQRPQQRVQFDSLISSRCASTLEEIVCADDLQKQVELQSGCHGVIETQDSSVSTSFPNLFVAQERSFENYHVPSEGFFNPSPLKQIHVTDFSSRVGHDVCMYNVAWWQCLFLGVPENKFKRRLDGAQSGHFFSNSARHLTDFSSLEGQDFGMHDVACMSTSFSHLFVAHEGPLENHHVPSEGFFNPSPPKQIHVTDFSSRVGHDVCMYNVAWWQCLFLGVPENKFKRRLDGAQSGHFFSNSARHLTDFSSLEGQDFGMRDVACMSTSFSHLFVAHEGPLENHHVPSEGFFNPSPLKQIHVTDFSSQVGHDVCMYNVAWWQCLFLGVPENKFKRRLDGAQSGHFFSNSARYKRRNSKFSRCDCSRTLHVGLTRFQPIGEALNPGPPWVIRTFNPTQLYKNEMLLGEWVDGIYTACETSHTVAARNVMIKNLRNCDVNVIFSEPVEKQRNSAGIFRGKASGTMVASRFPISPYPQVPPEEVKVTSRFVDGIVNIGGGNNVYTCAVYGPPVNGTYADSDKMFLSAAMEGIKRACSFKGMAAITGDFNRDLHDCVFWEHLRSLGWQDCAQLAWERFQWQPEPTCRDATRRSFILVNPALASVFTDCRCVDHELFDSHPVLQATFDCETKLNMKTVWNLPRSMDDLVFDTDIVNDQAQIQCMQREAKFQDALDTNQMDEALQQFALAFEQSFDRAAVTVDGNEKTIPMGCWKRCRSKLVVQKPVGSPLLKRAREGDLNLPVCQPNISIRRHVKQCRRVLSLRRQMAANSQGVNSQQHIQCEHLWRVICEANGFSHGFPKWVLQELGLFFPRNMPGIEYLDELYYYLHEWVQGEINRDKKDSFKAYRLRMIEDVISGGRLAFRSVRDHAPPPLSFIGHEVSQKLKGQRWKKDGNRCLLAEDPIQLQCGLPATFQDQQVMINAIEGNRIWVDKPLKCKEFHDLHIVQKLTTANPNDMQSLVCDAWSKLWGQNEGTRETWSDALAFITSMHDCESCPYKDFNLHDWKSSLKGINLRSARGACGFSPKDVTRMPDVLTEWLFKIFRKAENDCPWPDRMTTARVVMLSKPGEDNDKPLSCRSITVLSVLYRLWSRFRSLQVLEFLNTQ